MARESNATDGLLAGFQAFRRKGYAKNRGLYRRLGEKGQQPKTLIISCSDSRVSPTAIFSAKPGDIFVARNIAAIVPPHDKGPLARTIGSVLEYAVKALKVSNIVVMGHARCGGVNALVAGGHGLDGWDYVPSWVEIAAPARALLPPEFERLGAEERASVSEQAVVKVSVGNLLTYPWIKERVDARALGVHGWHFDFHPVALRVLDRKSGNFTAVR